MTPERWLISLMRFTFWSQNIKLFTTVIHTPKCLKYRQCRTHLTFRIWITAIKSFELWDQTVKRINGVCHLSGVNFIYFLVITILSLVNVRLGQVLDIAKRIVYTSEEKTHAKSFEALAATGLRQNLKILFIKFWFISKSYSLDI